MNKQEKPLSTLWGCELSESKKEETFKTDDTNHQHQLALRTMCLGAGAKEEFNIVALITGEPDNGKGIPMATLHANGMPTVNLSGIDLHPPVTFRLKSGAGPVYICGEHVALEDDFSGMESGDEMDDEVEEEEEEEEDIESPVKPAKKTPAKNANAAGKRKKPEEADE
ncbi:nucleoplasmin [Coregonus clupeaformis]|nr:nucleoplasmin [Coregonus clupeaformis]